MVIKSISSNYGLYDKLNYRELFLIYYRKFLLLKLDVILSYSQPNAQPVSVIKMKTYKNKNRSKKVSAPV